MRWLALALVFVGGCDWIFRIDAVPAGDGGAVVDDGRGGDGPAAVTCRKTGDQVALPLFADTYLDSNETAGGVGLGNRPYLSLNTNRTVLLAFEVGDVRFTQVELHLAHQLLGCSGGCGACLTTPGDISVFLLRTDWDEASANYLERSTGISWEGKGATGGADRSASAVAMPTYANGDELVATLQFQDTDRPAAGSGVLLGIEVAPNLPTALDVTFTSKEGSAGLCGEMHAAPRLIGTCP